MRSVLDAVRPAPKFDAGGRRVPRWRWTPDATAWVANLGGGALIAYGVGMIFPPAGVIVAGLALVVLGKAATMPSLTPPSNASGAGWNGFKP